MAPLGRPSQLSAELAQHVARDRGAHVCFLNLAGGVLPAPRSGAVHLDLVFESLAFSSGVSGSD